MATQVPPKKNSAFTFETALTSQSDTDTFQTSVTLAAGDVKVSKDGGSFSNIGTLPSEISTTGVLTVALTSTEMNADRVAVLFHDASGSQWQDLLVTIHTVTTSQIDDLATVTALATVDSNVDAILADTGTDGVVLANDAITAAKIAADAITSSELADGAITAAKIATDAITAAKIAADAITSSELASSAAQEIADAVLVRGVSNVEDTADATSLAALVLAAFESALSSTTWTIYKTDHSTTFTTRTVTADTGAAPIVEVT